MACVAGPNMVGGVYRWIPNRTGPVHSGIPLPHASQASAADILTGPASNQESLQGLKSDMVINKLRVLE